MSTEGRRCRWPTLFHVWLGWRLVRIRTRLGRHETGLVARRRVIDGWRGHVSDARVRPVRRPMRPDGLRHHAMAHAAHVIPRVWPRWAGGLRREASLEVRMTGEWHAVGYRGRRRSCVMAKLGKGLRRLALEMGRHHVRLHSIRPPRRRPITVFVVFVVVLAAVVVGRALVLVGATMLCHHVSEPRPRLIQAAQSGR